MEYKLYDFKNVMYLNQSKIMKYGLTYKDIIFRAKKNTFVDFEALINDNILKLKGSFVYYKNYIFIVVDKPNPLVFLYDTRKQYGTKENDSDGPQDSSPEDEEDSDDYDD